MIHSEPDYEADPFLAISAVSALLRSGCLNLFIGSGVSSGFGLPNWALLVARIVGRGGDAAYVNELRAKSDKELSAIIEPFDNGSDEFPRKVHAALYEGVPSNLLEKLKSAPLLTAVAALLSKSLRGHVQRVFTYNYDDLLEQYLEMIGYVVCVRTSPSDFAVQSDVELNYVHGRLPETLHDAEVLPELVLGEHSYRKRRAEITEGWSAVVSGSLFARSALLLGLSADDSVTLDIFQHANTRIQRPGDYIGYWLLTPDAFARNRKAVQDVGMCPIPIAKERIPEFLFDVCKAARTGAEWRGGLSSDVRDNDLRGNDSRRLGTGAGTPAHPREPPRLGCIPSLCAKLMRPWVR